MSKESSEFLAKRALQVQRGAARAAVLGVNDGLVSVLCLVLAVAGAGAPPEAVLLAGFGGLIAGAFSMSAGEWISVQSQVELFRGILSDVKRLMKRDRQTLIDQLASDLEGDGLSSKTAASAAKEIARKDERLIDEYATHVMGFNPDELGSPWVAAVSSFALFTVGAMAPLAPWFFTSGALAIWLSLIFTALGSAIVGGYIAVSSGRSVAFGAVRQFLIVSFAAAVTYSIGVAFGAVAG